MKKLFNLMITIIITFFFISAGTLWAQNITQNFEGFSIGDSTSIGHISWAPTDIKTVIVADPLGSGSKVLKVTSTNYNAAPVLMFVLPAGKTLADYDSVTFDGYFQAGDVSYKLIIAEAYQTNPIGHHFLDADTNYSYNRAQGVSTGWEHISLAPNKASTFSDTVYIAIGTNNSGATWYMDNVTLVAKAASGSSLVSQWGKTSLGTAWPLVPNANAGNIGIGNGKVPTGWATVSGHFGTLTATTTQAVVVTGQMQFVGGGGASAYTWLRYALTFQDSATLNYAGTDSALWVSSLKHYGYEFDPISGAGTMANSNAGQGTIWAVNNGNWSSTYSNGGPPLAAIMNQPYNAEAIAGTYNFAISVESVNDTVNQLNWYLEEQNNKYWFGGSIQVVSTSKKFNAISFGFNNDFQGTQVNFTNVQAQLGAPITVPAAPWESYYLKQWGITSPGGYWPITNDSTTIIGNGTIKGSAPVNGSGWATIEGGFGQALKVPTNADSALLVTGQLVFTGTKGGDDSYTPLRYAIAYEDSATLKNALTDSAKWVSGSGSYTGYGFMPVSGAGTMSNASGKGQGTVWTINNGTWYSTYANGNPVSQALQQPYQASIIPGTYNFAFSITQVNDTTNEIRWYLIEQNNKYWFGGTVMAPANTNKFNAICFGVNTGDWTQLDVENAMVDYGKPITVPAAPWQSYYLKQWGITSPGGYWPITNDSTTVIGNGTIKGSAPVNGSGWATIEGGFGQALTVPMSTDSALIVTGQLVFTGTNGGDDSYTPLRYAIAYEDSATLKNALTDSAKWVSGSGSYTGYGFMPVSGAGQMSNAAGKGQGTVWTVNHGTWYSTYANGNPVSQALQAPYQASIIPGTYNFAFSISQVNDTTNEIRWYLIEQNNKYWFGGTVMAPANTNKFNAICFGVNTGDWTQLDVENAMVDYGKAITVPSAPWQDFYVKNWGFYQGQMGGWLFMPGDVVGNAGIGGSKANTGWAAIRGDITGAAPRNGVDSSLVINGQIELDGGGFQSAGSLRFGLFSNANPGKVTVISDTVNGVVYDSTNWTGSNAHESGYLFIPPSGSNPLVNWGSTPGTWGSVINGAWDSTNTGYVLGSDAVVPANAEGTAGTYNFAISVAPAGNGKQEIAYELKKTDNSYILTGAAIDNHSTLPATQFNGIIFALGPGNTTTALKLTNVQVTLGKPLVVTSVDNEPNSGLPMSYSLSQNYPNPFNPSTTINFALPKSGNVSLVVYDILGREVAHLVNGELQAGYHKVEFNADNLASGVYFYRLKAGDFVSVKKLMLLK